MSALAKIGKLPVAKEPELRQSFVSSGDLSDTDPFEAIFRHGADAMTLMDTSNGRYVDVNDEFLRLTGYARVEVIGRRPADLGLEFDAETLLRIAESLKATGAIHNVEIPMKLPNGSTLTVLWSAVKLQLGDRRCRLAIARDITELRRAESALRETEGRLREIIEHAPLMITAIDRDGKYTLLQGRGVKMISADSAAIVGRSAFEVHRDRPGLIEGMRAALEGEESLSETEINGHHFEVWRGPICNADGEITGAFGVNTDITARVRAEREMLIRLRQNEAIAHLAARALEGASVAELLAEAAESARTGLQADFASVLEYDGASRGIRISATTGDDAAEYLNLWTEEQESTLWSFVLNAGEPVISEDLSADVRFRAPCRLLERGARSAVSAPIRSRSADFGVLSAYSRTPRSYTREATGFIRSLANVLAVAIERSRSESRLRENEDYLRTLIENSTDIIVVLDEQNRIGFINETGARMFGLAAESMIGRAGADFVHPQDLPIRDRNFLFARANPGVPARCELRLLGGDGGWRVCEIVTRAIEQIGGAPGLLVNLRDITARRAAERDRALLASIVAASDDAIMSFTFDGVITSWNGGAERLYGHPARRMIGRDIKSLLPSAEVADLRRRFGRIEAGASDDHYETKRLRSDYSTIEVSVTLSPIRDADGVVIGVAAIARDITERKRAEAELKRARDAAVAATRLKSAFLANMSHEIRTPINIILGYGDLIGDQLAERGDTSQSEYLDAISRASRRLLHTISSILDYSRLESGDFRLERRPLRIAEIVAHEVDEARELAAEKGLALELEIGGADLVAEADDYSVAQAVRQILDNAIKFTNRGGVQVRIERGDPGAGVRVVVADTGVGIDPEFLSRLLEPFSQEDSGYTRKFEGAGLGLALARRFLDLNDASLKIESRKGEGSTVTLQFPPAGGGNRAHPASGAPSR